MKKYLIVGNWKMNPGTFDEARNIVRKVKRVSHQCENVETVVCPPFPFLSVLNSRNGSANFHAGAQDVSLEENGGAHTGEVGAPMIASLGVEYVIVGHSEKRKAGDTDLMISKKINMVLGEGMTPIVCVGETERKDDGSHFAYIREQMKNSFADIPQKYSREIVIAYEPVWAIGAKEAMVASDIYEMSLFIKKTFADIFGQTVAVKMKVLYGGSVNFRNAFEILTIGKVDGLLVGRESVNTVGFCELIKVANNLEVK